MIIFIQSDLIFFSTHDLSNQETFYSMSFEEIDGRWDQIKMVVLAWEFMNLMCHSTLKNLRSGQNENSDVSEEKKRDSS